MCVCGCGGSGSAGASGVGVCGLAFCLLLFYKHTKLAFTVMILNILTSILCL